MRLFIGLSRLSTRCPAPTKADVCRRWRSTNRRFDLASCRRVPLPEKTLTDLMPDETDAKRISKCPPQASRPANKQTRVEFQPAETTHDSQTSE